MENKVKEVILTKNLKDILGELINQRNQINNQIQRDMTIMFEAAGFVIKGGEQMNIAPDLSKIYIEEVVASKK